MLTAEEGAASIDGEMISVRRKIAMPVPDGSFVEEISLLIRQGECQQIQIWLVL